MEEMEEMEEAEMEEMEEAVAASVTASVTASVADMGVVAARLPNTESNPNGSQTRRKTT